MSQFINLAPEEQWEDVPVITMDGQWDTIKEAKLMAKVMIVEQGESWGPLADSDGH